MRRKRILKRIAALSALQLVRFRDQLREEGIDFAFEVNEPATPPPVVPAEERDYYPLSPVQMRMFLLARMGGAGIVYNVPMARLLQEKPDPHRMQKALEHVIRRHSALRTSFQVLNGEVVQRVHPQVEFKLETIELETIEPESENTTGTNDEHLKRRVLDLFTAFIRPFDLEKAPLLRACLVSLPGDRGVLMLDMHHIVSDLTSKKILIPQVLDIYRAPHNGSLSLEPGLDYKDYTMWLRVPSVRALLQKQEQYWLNQFTPAPLVPAIAADHPRPAKKDYRGGNARFKIINPESDQLKTIARDRGTTLFVVVLAIYNILLSRIGLRDDITVGVPIIGRGKGLENVVGMFVNTLVMRNRPTEEKTFDDFLEAVKKNTLDAFENRDYPFGELVNRVAGHRDPSRNPLFDVFYSFLYPRDKFLLQEEFAPNPDGENNPVAGDENNGRRLSMFDLYLYGLETPQEILLGFTYAAALFNPGTIERYVKYFREITLAVIRDPGIRLSDITISHDLALAASTTPEEEDDFDF